MSMNVWFVLAT